MTKAQKIFRMACGIVMAGGFLLLIGTAGASDQNLIPFGQIVGQSIAGLLLFAGAGTLGGFIWWR